MSGFEGRRQAAGLSRKEASDLSGVTQGAIWSLENDKNTRDKSATDKYTSWLDGYTTRAVSRGGRPEAVSTVAVGGRVVSHNWNGLTPGSTFKVKDLSGTFTFRGHVTEPKGTEYIDCYGGSPGHGRLHCIRPERIRARNWKPTPAAVTQAKEEDHVNEDED